MQNGFGNNSNGNQKQGGFGSSNTSGFAGLGDVDASNDRIHFEEPGSYIIALEKVVYDTGEPGSPRAGEPYCAWEVRVLKRHSETGKAEGITVSKADYLSGKRKQYAQKDVKKIMAAFLRERIASITEAVAFDFVADDGADVQAMWAEEFGCEPVIHLEVKGRQAKNGKTYFNWHPSKATQDEITYAQQHAPA